MEAFGPESYDAEQVAAWAKRGRATSLEDESPNERVVTSGSHEPGDYDLDDSYLVTRSRRARSPASATSSPPSERLGPSLFTPSTPGVALGTALLASLEGYTRACDLPHLNLTSSLNAVGFYERAGYGCVWETIHLTRPDVPLPVVAMRKDIRGPKG